MGEIQDFINLYIEDSGMIEEMMEDVATNLKAKIQDELDSGNPKPNGYIRGDLHDSIESDVVSHNKHGGVIEAYTMNGYAPYVNDGHPQQPGRFIPGSWNGDRFIYTPGAKTGMVLKKSYVEGLHFMEHGLDATVAMYR